MNFKVGFFSDTMLFWVVLAVIVGDRAGDHRSREAEELDLTTPHPCN